MIESNDLKMWKDKFRVFWDATKRKAVTSGALRYLSHMKSHFKAIQRTFLEENTLRMIKKLSWRSLYRRDRWTFALIHSPTRVGSLLRKYKSLKEICASFRFYACFRSDSRTHILIHWWLIDCCFSNCDDTLNCAINNVTIGNYTLGHY